MLAAMEVDPDWQPDLKHLTPCQRQVFEILLKIAKRDLQAIQRLDPAADIRNVAPRYSALFAELRHRYTDRAVRSHLYRIKYPKLGTRDWPPLIHSYDLSTENRSAFSDVAHRGTILPAWPELMADLAAKEKQKADFFAFAAVVAQRSYPPVSLSVERVGGRGRYGRNAAYALSATFIMDSTDAVEVMCDRLTSMAGAFAPLCLMLPEHITCKCGQVIGVAPSADPDSSIRCPNCNAIINTVDHLQSAAAYKEPGENK